MIKLLAASVAAAGLLSACATVDESRFASWDSDNDRMLSRAEYDRFRSNFATWDTDRDSWVSEQEFEAGFRDAGWRDWREGFEAFDRDRNRYLNREEFFSERDWNTWDRDRDGRLDDDEWFF